MYYLIKHIRIDARDSMNIALIAYKSELTNKMGSGMLRYIYELYTGIKANKDIKVDVLEPRGNKVLSGIFGNALPWVLGNVFNKYGFDIIHDINFYRMPILASKKSVTISTAHDFIYLTRPDIVSKDVHSIKDKIWLNAIIKFTLQTSFLSDFIIADTTATMEDAIRLGYDKKRIFVVNLGIDKRFFVNSHIRTKTTNFKVGYVGSFGFKKNVRFAIDSFNQLKDKKIILDIYGKRGYEYPILSKLAEKNKQIRFPGFVPEQNLVNVYDSLDAFVFPSLHEGFIYRFFPCETASVFRCLFLTFFIVTVFF